MINKQQSKVLWGRVFSFAVLHDGTDWNVNYVNIISTMLSICLTSLYKGDSGFCVRYVFTFLTNCEVKTESNEN